jgi:hypothetical protein
MDAKKPKIVHNGAGHAPAPVHSAKRGDLGAKIAMANRQANGQQQHILKLLTEAVEEMQERVDRLERKPCKCAG